MTKIPDTDWYANLHEAKLDDFWQRRANELREEIKAIDPNAALYYGWAGPGDER